MKDGFVEVFTLCPSNTKKFDVYFKKYIQTCITKTIKLYISMKEFRLAKGM
jgi:hypothetical protein